MKNQFNALSEVSNDTLILTLWTLREDDFTEHSPDVRQRYELVLEELIERKDRGVLPIWVYVLPIVNNDLSHLSDVDNDFVNAMVSPIFLVA